jgi:5-(carboxyamino)imidazole ribonucleotide mutase
MKPAEEVLGRLGVETDVRVISAHRTPDRLTRFLAGAEDAGIEVVICGAGGAAHLAGVTAAHTLLPVLGVPIQSSPLSGLDSLLSTVQMPGGIPVATFGIGRSGAKNAVCSRRDHRAPTRSCAPREHRAQESSRVPERP